MAIPGVTAPEVQAALIGFCEEKKSCFALLDVPMERTLERRLREETAQQPHARRADRQETTAEQKRREPTVAVDRSAAAEPFQKPKVSRPGAEEPSKMNSSQPVPPRSSGAKPEWEKDEPDGQTRTVGIEAGDDFHSLPANFDWKLGEPAPKKHGFSPINQDIRTSATEKQGLAEHTKRLPGDPEPGKPLPRSVRIPQTQELPENNSSREIYIRKPEELTLREFHTPEPDAEKTGLKRRDSSESLRQSARRTSDDSQSGGSTGKAAKLPVSENTAAGPAASPVSMAVTSIDGELVFDALWKESESIIKLTMGKGLLSFTKRVCLRNQVGKVVVWGRDVNEKFVQGSAASVKTGGKGKSAAQLAPGLKGAVLREFSEFARTAEECTRLAQAKLDGLSMFGVSRGGMKRTGKHPGM